MKLKRIIAYLGLGAAIMATPVALAASSQKQVTINVTVSNAAPSVSSLTLYEGGTTTTVNTGSTLDPDSEYDLSFQISDNNGLSDIDQIVVKVYYGSSEPGSTDVHEYVIFTGTVSGGSISWSANPSSGWTIQTVDGLDTSKTSDTVKVRIGIPKVAKEDQSTANWRFKVEVTDNSGASDSATLGGYKMGPYVSLSLGSNSLSFELNPGASDSKNLQGTIIANDQWVVNARRGSLPSQLQSISIAGVSLTTSDKQIDSGSTYTGLGGSTKTWSVSVTAATGAKGSGSVTVTITAVND